MKQKSKVREYSEYAKSACISMVFPFGAFAPDGRKSGHQWHSRGQRFDPAYLHQEDLKSKDFRSFSLFLAQKVVVVMFKTHSSLPFRPLVFHPKIKDSRGGISWLVSQ